MLATLSAICSITLGSSLVEPPPTHDQVAGKPSLVATDAQLKSTLVVATLEHDLVEGKSVLWCGTMPMAWQELVQAMGSPLTTDAQGPSGAMIGSLNATGTSKADLDSDSYVAMAGFGKDDILKKIREALQQRFKGAASPKLLPDSLNSDEIFAYSYLFKNLEFAEPFLRREIPLGFQRASVAAFGLWPDHRADDRWGALAKQVSILSYTSPESWTVELKSKAAGDRLIIARLDKKKTLAETVVAALGAGKDQKPQSMNRADRLVVPLLNFDITRTFGELAGVMLRGPKASGLITGAIQNIRFRLDEKGAVLKSEASLRATASAVPRQVREMVCDGPFLIVMMRADAKHPYFAAWVDNPEILVGMKK
ncbi:MAG: hypothetical protein IT438_16965 [Phycisphaerales bacterium]|nr:hypothetical protein [Phycisphaerales bacterium]